MLACKLPFYGSHLVIVLFTPPPFSLSGHFFPEKCVDDKTRVCPEGLLLDTSRQLSSTPTTHTSLSSAGRLCRHFDIQEQIDSLPPIKANTCPTKSVKRFTDHGLGLYRFVAHSPSLSLCCPSPPEQINLMEAFV